MAAAFVVASGLAEANAAEGSGSVMTGYWQGNVPKDDRRTERASAGLPRGSKEGALGSFFN